MTLDEAEKLAGIRGIAPLIPALNEAFPAFRWSLDPDRGLVVVESAEHANPWAPRDAGVVWLGMADGSSLEAKAEAQAIRVAEIEAAMKAQAQRMHPQATKVPNAVIGYDEYFRPAVVYTTSFMDPTQSAKSLTWPAEDDGA